MGPCGNNMPEKDSAAEVIEYKAETATTTSNDIVDPVEILTEDTKTPPKKPESKEPKPFTWMGVKFPAYFRGPHFIQVKGSIVLAIDPDCVSMEMRTNWINIYVPELAALGKKIIEKHLKIKIEKID